ncbi:MAG: branched-chain amino acid aminotransferase, partial [Phycisphaerae bacterium]
REENLTRYDLYVADECFLTGTAAEVVSVVRIDKRTIGSGKPGPVSRRLADEFHRRTRQ